jgi:serine/threonine protein kinase
MSISAIRERDCFEDVQGEIRNLKKAGNHRNLVSLVGEKITSENHYLFFELCNGGTLAELKQLADTLNEGVVRAIGL